MPANRLPWVKVWIEALDHEKFANLSDGEAWTWVVLLAKASQQPKRWRFASVEHAHRVSHRPTAHIRRLIAVSLLDHSEEGVAIHDASQWQDSSKIAPTMREQATNGDSTVTEQPPNGDPTVIHGRRNDDIEGEEDREEDVDVDGPFVNESLNAAAVAASPGPAAREGRDDDNGGGGFRSLGSLLNNDGGRRRRPRLDLSDPPDEVRERLQRPPIGSPS
jgi:hypothetical protein